MAHREARIVSVYFRDVFAECDLVATCNILHLSYVETRDELLQQILCYLSRRTKTKMTWMMKTTLLKDKEAQWTESVPSRVMIREE